MKHKSTTPIWLIGWLWLLLIATQPFALAQQAAGTQVKGKVTSETGEGIPGVSVVLKGTATGASTDASGNYALQLANPNGTLVFSYIGYTSEEVAVNNRTTLDVKLVPDVKSLSEVVVVGYGTQKRSDLTGSVVSISSKDIKEMPIATVEQAMQGRLAGVQIQQSSGQPGAGISIRVRGVTSIAGGNEPLFVIDGLPQFNSDVRATNALASINPSDIESIEVLKDASATAIYGSRGANGVVMVTTKSGKSGQMRVTYDTYVGAQTVRKKLNLMNGEEYLAFAKEVFTNANKPIPAELANATNANTDWQNEVFRTGLQQNHNLSFSGGADKMQYYISAGYLNQNGIVPRSNYERGALRMNLSAKLSERIAIQTRFTASRGVQNGFSPSDGTNTQNFGKSGIGSTLLSVPTVPVRNPDGTYSLTRPYSFSGIDVENPVAFANEALDRRTITRVQGGMDLKVTLLKGLVNTARVGIDYLGSRNDTYLPKVLPQVSSGLGIGRLGLNTSFNVLAEDFLEYKTNLMEGLAFEAIAGVSFQTQRTDYLFIEASNFLSDDLKSFSISSAANVTKPTTDIIKNTIASAFGRVRFSYREKYLLSGSLRGDGASVFSTNNKYGLFPSVSLGWKISEEDFIKNNLPITNLKLKASWGQSGNPAIQPYQSLLLGNVVNTGQGGGTSLVVGLAPTLPNSNLTWETTTQANVGLDIGVKDDRYRGSIDYYVKNTTSLLATVQLPPSAGYNTIIDNVGEVKNSGVELTLGANLINTTNFRWTVDANLAWNKNRVMKTKDNRDLLSSGGSNDASQTTSLIRVGEPLSSFYGPRFKGFDENGKQTWVDQNGDGKIDAKDFVPLGSPYPKLVYGLTMSLSYQRLTLSTTWQGVKGARVNNVGLYALTQPTAEFNRLKNIHDYYPTPNPTDVRYDSDLFVEDASFLRLKNIRLDYRLPLENGKLIKNANIYFTAQNLLTITKYSGFDPEVNSFSGNDIRQGADLGAYPTAKSYTLGLSVTF